MADQHALSFGDTASGDDKTFALLAHLSVYVSWWLGPLVMMLIFKDKAAFVKYHAVQALAMQIALSVLGAIVATLTCGFGTILLLPLALVPLYGAYVAYQGQWSGYPGLSSFGR